MHEQFRMVLVLEEPQLRSGPNTRKTTQILAGWVARTRPLNRKALPLSSNWNNCAGWKMAGRFEWQKWSTTRSVWM